MSPAAVLKCSFFLLAGLVGTAVGARPHGAPAGIRFVSEAYAFSFVVPQGWFHTSSDSSNARLLTELFSFNPEEALRRLGRIVVGGLPEPPKGGAIVDVITEEGLMGPSSRRMSPPELAAEYWKKQPNHDQLAHSPAILAVEMPPESEVSGAIRAAFDVEPYALNLHVQRHVIVCWRFKQRSFVADLQYLKGDPSGPTFEKTLLETVPSIRPLQK
jgi:hypothetical protein